MDPTTVYRLGHARLADMHRQAERDSLARTARQIRRPATAVTSRPTALTRWAHRLGRVSVP
jgi:hypothetical protein